MVTCNNVVDNINLDQGCIVMSLWYFANLTWTGHYKSKYNDSHNYISLEQNGGIPWPASGSTPKSISPRCCIFVNLLRKNSSSADPLPRRFRPANQNCENACLTWYECVHVLYATHTTNLEQRMLYKYSDLFHHCPWLEMRTIIITMAEDCSGHS